MKKALVLSFILSFYSLVAFASEGYQETPSSSREAWKCQMKGALDHIESELASALHLLASYRKRNSDLL